MKDITYDTELNVDALDVRLSSGIMPSGDIECDWFMANPLSDKVDAKVGAQDNRGG